MDKCAFFFLSLFHRRALSIMHMWNVTPQYTDDSPRLDWMALRIQGKHSASKFKLIIDRLPELQTTLVKAKSRQLERERGREEERRRERESWESSRPLSRALIGRDEKKQKKGFKNIKRLFTFLCVMFYVSFSHEAKMGLGLIQSQRYLEVRITSRLNGKNTVFTLQVHLPTAQIQNHSDKQFLPDSGERTCVASCFKSPLNFTVFPVKLQHKENDHL